MMNGMLALREKTGAMVPSITIVHNSRLVFHVANVPPPTHIVLELFIPFIIIFIVGANMRKGKHVNNSDSFFFVFTSYS